MKKIVPAIVLIVFVAWLAGLARSGALPTVTTFLDSLSGEGFKALRGV